MCGETTCCAIRTGGVHEKNQIFMFPPCASPPAMVGGGRKKEGSARHAPAVRTRDHDRKGCCDLDTWIHVATKLIGNTRHTGQRANPVVALNISVETTSGRPIRKNERACSAAPDGSICAIIASQRFCFCDIKTKNNKKSQREKEMPTLSLSLCPHSPHKPAYVTPRTVFGPLCFYFFLSRRAY